MKKQHKDRISDLSVVDEILSRMPIRDAVRTSVLSRSWRYKWASIPHLVFDHQFLPNVSRNRRTQVKVTKIVDHVLLHHNASIHKFELSLNCLLCLTDIDKWILHLSRKSVKEFILNISYHGRYEVPSSLFSCQSLSHLKLHSCLLKPPSTFKGFKNLKSLYLYGITIGQDVLESFITLCPMLERLDLAYIYGFRRLKVDAPNLRSVVIIDSFNDVRFENTSHLTEVSIVMNRNKPMEPLHNSRELIRLFSNLPCIRWLEIESHFLKYLASRNVPSRLPSMCTHLNYLTLHISFEDLNERLATSCLLRSSPNLQELRIFARMKEGNETCLGTPIEFCNIGDNRDFVFMKLRLVKINDIVGNSYEMDFIKFLLCKSPVLKEMIVEPVSGYDGGCQLLEELVRFRRAPVITEIIHLDP